LLGGHEDHDGEDAAVVAGMGEDGEDADSGFADLFGG